MATLELPSTRRNGRPARDRAQLLAELRQRFVALPDPNNATGWLVDLRDPFHPATSHYETWAAAEDAANALIAQLLRECLRDEARLS